MWTQTNSNIRMYWQRAMYLANGSLSMSQIESTRVRHWPVAMGMCRSIRGLPHMFPSTQRESLSIEQSRSSVTRPLDCGEIRLAHSTITVPKTISPPYLTLSKVCGTQLPRPLNIAPHADYS